MRLISAATCILALAASSISAQQPFSSGLISKSANVASPILLPSQPVAIFSGKCKKKNQASNDVRFSLFVDADGNPRRIYFLRALGNSLDQTALDLVHTDRFTPARRDGEPVAAWQSIDITLQSCRENPKDKSGFPTYRLISQPVQNVSAVADPPKASPVEIHPAGPYRIGGRVSAPDPLRTPEAHYSAEARRKRIQAVCLVRLVVDAEGMPQNPSVVRSAGYGLDENALEAIRHYRFKPSLKDGFEPVPVKLTVEVDFRLY